MKRIAIRVRGIVQGVGFRPFVHRLAARHDLAGTVLNDTLGVVVDIQGRPASVDAFAHELIHHAPPLARISSVEQTELPVQKVAGFTILPSREEEERLAFYAPDAALCHQCRDELLDKKDRRYGYPFISCINCGPRFSIVNHIPYDRVNTEMGVFIQCDQCLEEYTDVTDRRFHSQPNACAQCGPRVALHDSSGTIISEIADDVAARTAALLNQGAVVAIKGMGGYHLACAAESEHAVMLLRERKRRPFKPFALMARHTSVIERYVELSNRETELLTSMERPIVLLKINKRGEKLITAVAPGLTWLGFMLPSTPFQELLFEKHQDMILVMTSANLSDEPIVFDDDDAFRRLKGIADYFVTYNRAIAAQSDDSVLMVVDGDPLFVRRARGYVPAPFKGRLTEKTILAMGGDMKNAFALARSEFIIMSQYLGDMADMRTQAVFRRTVEHFIHVFDAHPEVIAADLHPGYMTTALAREMALEGCELFFVQHHHAHIASVMEEHDLDGTVIGLAFDGTGYGTDGKLWGSEILVASRKEFIRKGHFSYFDLPGGESAIKDVWKIGQSLLIKAFGDDIPEQFRIPETALVAEILKSGINCPETCSIGRLFDGIASILDLSQNTTSDAEAAQLLEEQAMKYKGNLSAEPLPVVFHDSVHIIDSQELVRRVCTLNGQGADPARCAAYFHELIILSALDVVDRVREETGEQRVALSGGAFHNRILLSELRRRLTERGFLVYCQRNVPVNDGGLALGQVAIVRELL